MIINNNFQNKYQLVSLTDLDKSAQLRVLDIRNQEHIRKCMYADDVISAEVHLAWIERLKGDGSQVHFVIVDDDTSPVGAVNLKKIDSVNKTAELGFYKSRDNNEKGLMFRSLCALVNHGFDVLGLEKIYSEVFEGNERSLSIHKKLLFTEEGILRSHIVKDGERIGVHLFGLLRSEWMIKKFKNKINGGKNEYNCGK